MSQPTIIVSQSELDAIRSAGAAALSDTENKTLRNRAFETLTEALKSKSNMSNGVAFGRVSWLQNTR
jgi:hypothetical protein